MYYTIGVTCEFNGHEQYTVVIAWQYNPPISKFISTCIEFTSLKQFGWCQIVLCIGMGTWLQTKTDAYLQTSHRKSAEIYWSHVIDMSYSSYGAEHSFCEQCVVFFSQKLSLCKDAGNPICTCMFQTIDNNRM